MTTPARQEEAEKASAAFQVALTQIGAATVQEALAIWQDVPVDARAATSARWLRRAINLVVGRRRQSRDLARAYYRLVRALVTGSTVADPYHPEPETVSLQDLREEFAELAGDASAQAPPQEGEVEPEQEYDPPDEDDQIFVEELERLREEEERIEREAEAEARAALEALGTANLAKKNEAINTERPAQEVDEERRQAHLEAGARQAAAAERIAMNGARSTVWNHMDKDKKVLGYVRVSRSGTPCGWCAMLISRGPVYSSAKSAGGGGEYEDGDKYHDNCHCYAMPIFSSEQWRETPLFDLNRKYAAEWPRVTRGLYGKAALSAWRKYIRQQQKAAAQEAERTTSVQEA